MDCALISMKPSRTSELRCEPLRNVQVAVMVRKIALYVGRIEVRLARVDIHEIIAVDAE